MRADLPLGAQMAQACHAAHEAGAAFGAPSGCYLIVTHVADLAALRAQHDRLQAAGVRSVVFTEPDLGDQPTALAALVDHAGRKHFNRLPLWRLP